MESSIVRGLYRDYYRDPFTHSLLSTRQQDTHVRMEEATVI